MTTAVLKAYNKLEGRVTSFAMPKVNWKILSASLFLICFLLLIFYIYQIIDLTKISYSLNTYQNSIAKVSKDNKNLEVSFAENNFLSEVLQKAQEIGFQRTGSITYVQILNTSVAKAN